MKKVTFGMFREVYGCVTIDVPDHINEDNVSEYIEELFEECKGDYDFSDELEYEGDVMFVTNTRRLNKKHIVFGDKELWDITPVG